MNREIVGDKLEVFENYSETKTKVLQYNTLKSNGNAIKYNRILHDGKKKYINEIVQLKWNKVSNIKLLI